MALVIVTIWLSRPSVPFRFLEGAELEYESLDSEVFDLNLSLKDPDTLATTYTLRGSGKTVIEDARKELRQLGWKVELESIRMYAFSSRSGPIKYVAIYPLSEGLVDVELRSNASLFDKVKHRLGLFKRAK